MVLFLLLVALLLSPYWGGRFQGNLTYVGGFLVREDFVLTAAHCLGSSIGVTLGAHSIMERERTQQVIPVRRAFPHPHYNDKTFENDIMLLQLAWKADMTDAVSPISLPRNFQKVNPGMTCSVAGWGDWRDYIPITQICAGDPNKRKNSYSGDSGGPLCDGVAQGIVSYGDVYGTAPNVYTRISSFLYWIQKTMRQYKQQGSA